MADKTEFADNRVPKQSLGTRSPTRNAFHPQIFSYGIIVPAPDWFFTAFASTTSDSFTETESGMNNGELEIRAAFERMELYCAAYPRTPSAVRRPHLCRSGTGWMAILGDSVQHGIAGFGTTVESALREFDAQYLAALHPPEAPPKPTGKSRRLRVA
jgi:hypothetical protein